MRTLKLAFAALPRSAAETPEKELERVEKR